MTNAERVAAHAAELHRRAVVIDCHSDILMPIADGLTRLGMHVAPPDPATWKPPFLLPEGTPASLPWPHAPHFGCLGQYNLPQFRAGGLTTEVFAVFVEDQRLEVALRRALEMIWWLHREVRENGDLELVLRAADIRRLKKEGKCGAVLALEGLELLGQDLKLLDLLHTLGLRMACLTHNRRNAFADGTQYHIKTGGLTDLGRRAVKRMEELGIVVDVGHLNQVGFWETLEIAEAPVVLSHRSPRKFFPLDPKDSPFGEVYDLTRGRARLEALARNGGVFGVFFLGARDVDDVVSDIEHVLNTVGPDHVGLGSDLYGLEQAPKGLEDISGLPAITGSMVRRGHPDEVILKVLGENFLRVFEHAWKG